jgi:siroheme synthase
VAKRRSRHSMPQEEINALLVAKRWRAAMWCG